MYVSPAQHSHFPQGGPNGPWTGELCDSLSMHVDNNSQYPRYTPSSGASPAPSSSHSYASTVSTVAPRYHNKQRSVDMVLPLSIANRNEPQVPSVPDEDPLRLRLWNSPDFDTRRIKSNRSRRDNILDHPELYSAEDQIHYGPHKESYGEKITREQLEREALLQEGADGLTASLAKNTLALSAPIVSPTPTSVGHTSAQDGTATVTNEAACLIDRAKTPARLPNPPTAATPYIRKTGLAV